MMDDFECLLEQDEGDRLIHGVPGGLVSELASADEQKLRKVTALWAKTEELDCHPSDLEPFVEDLVRLCRCARTSGRNLFLWNCV